MTSIRSTCGSRDCSWACASGANSQRQLAATSNRGRAVMNTTSLDRKILLQQLAVALPELERPSPPRDFPSLFESIGPRAYFTDFHDNLGDILAIGIAGLGVGDAGRRNFPNGAECDIGAGRLANHTEACAEQGANARGVGRRLGQKLRIGSYHGIARGGARRFYS